MLNPLPREPDDWGPAIGYSLAAIVGLYFAVKVLIGLFAAGVL